MDYEILAINSSHEQRYFEVQANINAKVMSLTPEMLASSQDDEEQSRLLTMQDGVALVDVSGVLTNHYSYWNRYFGAVSYQEIKEATAQAVDLGAGCIVHKYDTPGGTARGMYDCANFIASLAVPTISFTGSMQCSAGYFLGCQSQYTYADSFAEVGSVGVAIKLYDRSKYLKELGIKPERFRSGELKATGDSDFALTEKEREYIKDQVLVYAGKFYDVVSEARGMPLKMLEKKGITSGRTFIGEEAVKVNLIDEIKFFDQTILKSYSLAKSFLDKQSSNNLRYVRN